MQSVIEIQPTHLTLCLLEASNLIVVSVHVQRHIHTAVTGEVLYLFHSHAGLNPPGDTGVSQLMRMTVEIQCSFNVGMLLMLRG